MQPVKEPRTEGDYHDRGDDGCDAVGKKLQQVVEAAMHAGWSRAEIRDAFDTFVTDWKQKDEA